MTRQSRFSDSAADWKTKLSGFDFTSGTDLSLLQNTHTGSGVHQTSYPIYTPCDHLLHAFPKSKMRTATTPILTYVFRCLRKIPESHY